MPLSTLPPEIISAIVDYVEPDLYNLAALSKTCKMMRLECDWRFYRKITVEIRFQDGIYKCRRPPHLIEILNRLTKTPKLATYVESIKVEDLTASDYLDSDYKDSDSDYTDSEYTDSVRRSSSILHTARFWTGKRLRRFLAPIPGQIFPYTGMESSEEIAAAQCRSQLESDLTKGRIPAALFMKCTNLRHLETFIILHPGEFPFISSDGSTKIVFPSLQTIKYTDSSSYVAPNHWDDIAAITKLPSVIGFEASVTLNQSEIKVRDFPVGASIRDLSFPDSSLSDFALENILRTPDAIRSFHYKRISPHPPRSDLGDLLRKYCTGSLESLSIIINTTSTQKNDHIQSLATFDKLRSLEISLQCLVDFALIRSAGKVPADPVLDKLPPKLERLHIRNCSGTNTSVILTLISRAIKDRKMLQTLSSITSSDKDEFHLPNIALDSDGIYWVGRRRNPFHSKIFR